MGHPVRQLARAIAIIGALIAIATRADARWRGTMTTDDGRTGFIRLLPPYGRFRGTGIAPLRCRGDACFSRTGRLGSASDFGPSDVLLLRFARPGAPNEPVGCVLIRATGDGGRCGVHHFDYECYLNGPEVVGRGSIDFWNPCGRPGRAP
jgi:hypothetical protein